jgi:DNA-binding NarL/FixJ family response regulator
MGIRLIIADDHDAMRETIKSFLSKWSDIDVVGEAIDGENAVKLAKKLLPDIVLMDMNMPRLNGIKAAETILSSNTGVRIVILSMNSDKAIVAAGLREGISGYVLKSSIFKDLIPALHAVMANEIYLSSQVADGSIQDRIRL